MTLLDAYALVALLVRGPAEPDVRALLHAGNLVMPTVNVAEVLDVAQRRGMPRELAWAGIEPLLEGPIDAMSLTLGLAREAAGIRAEHYHRRSRPLSLADCVLLASGARGDRVATADPHVLAVAPLVGLEPVALPSES